ncbi:uncharacterized protein B0I36DRAFT_235193 [Microdochium trichocladiopsis]|uniref:LDB19 N-terminal domain-containing protein n=1 Tax=Microdochium trichocladiopsis TaxID=1682393 RepID=A0A9P8YK68_9PEZI|nr:uncharacterized protein B0I36DRAFT_235193 [Microdochium trichocladiopsis]KAH7041403.1 hypothetical protein B0I36DRAFT_235193 [Microdochium trichocladiopsis]
MPSTNSHHRLSLGPLHLGAYKHKVSKDPARNELAALSWKIESPPAVMYGPADDSTGALVSGQLLLDIKEGNLEVENVEAELHIRTVHKRPFQAHCDKCSEHKTQLQKWSFLAEPTVLGSTTSHNFPFSSLLEGHLPASTDNSLLSISYEFTATVKFKDLPKHSLFLNKTINVKRALTVPELPHHSIRVFPPTNIKADVHYPQVIHPLGSNTLTLRLDGIVKHNTDTKTVEYWKLKRLTWKLEETITTMAPPCEKHIPKAASDDEAVRKGIKRTAERNIGHQDMHSGWKSDYSPDGCVEAEIDFSCSPSTKPNCDLKIGSSAQISHQLVVEMVVVQEFAPVNQPKQVTPTGIARILRMHFNVNVTERSGLGVSWDNEAPPIYQDVPPSPPGYTHPVSGADSVQDLVLGSAPVYTEGSYASSLAPSSRESSRPSSIHSSRT